LEVAGSRRLPWSYCWHTKMIILFYCWAIDKSRHATIQSIERVDTGLRSCTSRSRCDTCCRRHRWLELHPGLTKRICWGTHVLNEYIQKIWLLFCQCRWHKKTKKHCVLHRVLHFKLLL
jgi:hypothetical protein